MVIAGTGSIAYARNESGQTARVGGWGFQISDEGSGYWIGRTAVMQVMRAHDDSKGAPTALTKQILKAWSLNNVEQLVPLANTTPPPDFAQLFMPVQCEADAGDPLARSVLTRAGTELARLGKLAISRMFSESDSVPVAMAGGVFRNSALVRQVFYNAVQAEYPKANISSTVVEPVRGALELARRAKPQ
jgi:glucosamine kinase